MDVEIFHMLELSDEEMCCLWALFSLLEELQLLDAVELGILEKVNGMRRQ